MTVFDASKKAGLDKFQEPTAASRKKAHDGAVAFGRKAVRDFDAKVERERRRLAKKQKPRKGDQR